VAATVAQLRALAAPGSLPAASRIAPTELTTYAVTANVVKFKLEDDRDVHVVISDLNDPTQTMIVEFPDAVNCDGASTSAHAAEMQAARSALIARYGTPPSSSFKSLSGTATFVGVGFFDFKHGQTGVAPNAIELHPVLSFTTGTTAVSTPSSCTVDYVVDGDTFSCTDGVQVRMLQIDAQELGACGGGWAKAALGYIFLRPGTVAKLDYDATKVDTYGRRLAAPIVTGTDGADYNISIVMVYVGLAKAAHSDGNTKYLDWANASQVWAQMAQWNMWAPGGPYNGGTNCGDASTPPGEPAPVPVGGNCDPAYPDFCIPPPPPDLDCKDIPQTNFTVLPPDPHHLDGDHDGMGCET
jgi:endonuclease YncB( thermonuclease family)